MPINVDILVKQTVVLISLKKLKFTFVKQSKLLVLDYLCALHCTKEMSGELLFIIGFLAIVLLILVIDLGLFSKKSKNKENNNKSVSLKQAILMSIFVICVALGFYFS